MIASIRALPLDAAGQFEGVFFDIDDTFTSRGKIPAPAFNMLWALKEAGLKVVPITGRPAGWCDHIARMWPVDAVVGENGAFYFHLDEKAGKLRKRFLDPAAARHEKRTRLEGIEREVLALVPGAAIASDQSYRETDLAVDFCEDVPPLGWAEIERICSIFRSHGATCKVSSIHVNGWFGDYNKLGMTRIMAEELWGIDLDADRKRFLFCGDSPNDEPMFHFFPYSAGVNNVLRFADKMSHLPAFVADREGGEGFAEIAGTVLSLRQTYSTGQHQG
ncbi:MAG: HAD-IIB family hydrolase [Desulfobacteraceae bacterium]|nr:HAD-IIB family hydrolase [Desulfobacteraceae bacterium]